MSDMPKTRVGFRTRRRHDEGEPPTLGYHPQQLKALVGESRIRRAGAAVARNGTTTLHENEDYLEVVLAPVALPPMYPACRREAALLEPPTTIALRAGDAGVPSREGGLSAREAAQQRTDLRQADDGAASFTQRLGPDFNKQESGADSFASGVACSQGCDIPTRLAPEPSRTSAEPTEVLRVRRPVDVRLAVAAGIGLVALSIAGVRAAIRPTAVGSPVGQANTPVLARPHQVVQSASPSAPEAADTAPVSPPRAEPAPSEQVAAAVTSKGAVASAPRRVSQEPPAKKRQPSKDDKAGRAAANAADMLFGGDVDGAQSAYSELARESSTDDVYHLLARILRRRTER